MLEVLLLIAVGLVAGAVGAALGVGGGIILVPGFLFVAGLPFHEAVGASLVCVVGTSVASSIVYLRKRRVALDVAVELQFFAVVGAVGAGLVAALLPPQPLYLAFAAILLVTAVQMLPRAAHALAGAVAVGHARARPKAAAAAVGAGVAAGLLGVGGGIFNVPILHLVLRLPFERAVATSVYIVGITASAGAIVYVARGDVQVAVAGAAMLGTLVGAKGVAVFGDRLNQLAVRVAFVLVLLYVAARMALRGLG